MLNIYISGFPSTSTGSSPAELGESHVKLSVSPAFALIADPKFIETTEPASGPGAIVPAVPLVVKS